MELPYLADDHFGGPRVPRLREAGIEVVWGKEDAPGTDDITILARATREGRLILTLDRDCGDLIFHQGYRPPLGVVYFRYSPNDANPEELAERLLRLISEGSRLVGQFTVIARRGTRVRPLT